MTATEAINWLTAIDGKYKYMQGGDEEFNKRRLEAIHLAVCVLKAQQETEKNEPLTVAELQKMDGEPVYLRSDDYPGDCGWYVIKAVDKDEVIFTDGNLFLMSEYGAVWITYRRKPGDNAAPVHKLTNADRIRAMSDEELAEMLVATTAFDCITCGLYVNNRNKKRNEFDQCLKWLKQPAEVEI